MARYTIRKPPKGFALVQVTTESGDTLYGAVPVTALGAYTVTLEPTPIQYHKRRAEAINNAEAWAHFTKVEKDKAK